MLSWATDSKDLEDKENWKMPEEWKKHKNVFQETYEGMAKFINKQLTKSK